MKTLQEFLNQNQITGLSKDVPLSTRICNDNNEPYLFTIRSLTSDEISDIRNKSLKQKGNDTYVDKSLFDIALIILGSTYPNFKNADDIHALGCQTPEQYVQTVLLPGEISLLSATIQEFNGYTTSMDTLISQAKN